MLQASEGGSVSLGRSSYKVRPGGTPIAVPAGAATTDRIVRGVPTTTSPGVARRSAIAGEGELVLTKNTLIGLCLTAFACGIVTTLVVDRIHSRASDREPPSGHEVAPAAPRPAPQPAPSPAVTAAPAVTAQPVALKLPSAVEVATPPPPAASPRNPHPVPVHAAPARRRSSQTPEAEARSGAAAAPFGTAPAAKAATATISPAVKPVAVKPAPAKPAAGKKPRWVDPFAD